MSFVFKRLFLVALCVTLLGGMSAVASEEVICSPVAGRLVTSSGAPAAGVTVTRAWSWKSDSGEDSATTDANGVFTFEAVTRPGRRFRLLPQEPVILQKFTAFPNTGEVAIMEFYKRNTVLNGERENGRPMYVECVADAEPDLDEFFFGTCKPLEVSPAGS